MRMEKWNRVSWFLFFLQLTLSVLSSPIEESETFDSMKNVFVNDGTPSFGQEIMNVHDSNQEYTSICWAESIIITENKITKNVTISKAYSILLDTPDKLRQMHTESENASCLELLEHNSKPKKSLNFTVLKDTDEYVIKEHKTLFCGAGPVLSHHFIVWPKLNRKQIEISINPLSATKWENCTESTIDEDPLLGATSNHHPKSHSSKERGEIRSLEASEENNLPQPSGMVSDKPHKNIDSSVEAKIPIKTNAVRKHIIPPPPKEAKNILLRRDVNCTKDSLGICNEIIEKTSEMLGFKNSSDAVIGKWFFLDNRNNHLDRERSFKLNVKIVVNMKNATNDIDTNGTELVVEEDCMYVVPKN